MRKYNSFSLGVLLAVLFSLSSCAHAPLPPAAVATQDGLAESLFRDTEGCFLLYNMKTKNLEQVYNKAFCYERSPAAATFEVPLAMMAADKGLIQDEHTTFRWEGKDHGHPDLNKNQSAQSWFQNSVLWVSQSLTRKLGRKNITKYLRAFGFGDRDFSGDIDGAWLTADSKNLHSRRGTLKISPFEQLDFWEALWTGESDVSKHAVELTRSLTYLEKDHGFVLNGKIGSGTVGDTNEKRLGWFVGHVAGNGQEYLAVTRFSDHAEAPSDAEAGGPAAEEITLTLLRAAGLW